MKNTRLLLLAVALAVALSIAQALIAAPAHAQTSPTDSVVIYLFWGEGCPHCAAEKTFLTGLAQEHPGIVVRDFEVWQHPEYQEPLIRLAALWLRADRRAADVYR